MRVLFLTPSLNGNSIGRTYALWLAARHLGWETSVVAGVDGPLWAPLKATEFAAECTYLRDQEHLEGAARDADLVVAVKALPGSFGRALGVCRAIGKPLLLDIDDPDLDARLSKDNLSKALAKEVLRPRQQRAYRALRRSTKDFVRSVSNPELIRLYGEATIVPHARADPSFGAEHVSVEPRIVFVGTNRPHKGVPLLRRAVANLAEHGYTLHVTDVPPPDAKPWEQWVGPTSFEDGLNLVSTADIVVIPSSRRHSFASAQLPAKLMDAMLAGRAVCVADLAPLTWATSGTAAVFRSDDEGALTKELLGLRSPTKRDELGRAARERALEIFSVSAVAVAFAEAARHAMTRGLGSKPARS